MTLEEVKDKIVALLDEAWLALSGTADVDAARQVVSDTTTALTEHVQAAGQHLFDHVLENASQPEAAPEAAATVTLDPTSPAPTTPSSSSESPSSEDPSTTPGSEPSPTASSQLPTSETEAEPVADEAPVETAPTV